ncbi:MAG: hypothetical protein MJE68_32740 [Proteobacteria bacterium]|nr:hypothetical protein [Pseudomonadota bacterium]
MRQFMKDGKRRRSHGPSNAYFHARDLACLSRLPELENVTVDDLYIEESTFQRLTEGHRKILQQRKHWNAVRRNRASVIDKGF